MKYIILNVEGIECAVVFPDAVQHCNAVNLEQRKVLAAGFCSIRVAPADGEPRVKTWGESTSLRVKARPDDAQAVEFSLMCMGVLAFPPLPPRNNFDGAGRATTHLASSATIPTGVARSQAAPSLV